MLTTRREEGMTKVFADNKYIGFIEGDKRYAFNNEGYAVLFEDEMFPGEQGVLHEYLRLNKPVDDADSIIDALLSQLAIYEKSSAVVNRALDYLKRKGIK